jgi:hypothetical protein
MVTPIVHSTNVLPNAHERNGDRRVQPSMPPVLSLLKPGVAGDDAHRRAAPVGRARPVPLSAGPARGMAFEVAA